MRSGSGIAECWEPCITAGVHYPLPCSPSFAGLSDDPPQVYVALSDAFLPPSGGGWAEDARRQFERLNPTGRLFARWVFGAFVESGRLWQFSPGSSVVSMENPSVQMLRVGFSVSYGSGLALDLGQADAPAEAASASLSKTQDFPSLPNARPPASVDEDVRFYVGASYRQMDVTTPMTKGPERIPGWEVGAGVKVFFDLTGIITRRSR